MCLNWNDVAIEYRYEYRNNYFRFTYSQQTEKNNAIKYVHITHLWYSSMTNDPTVVSKRSKTLIKESCLNPGSNPAQDHSGNKSTVIQIHTIICLKACQRCPNEAGHGMNDIQLAGI